MFIVNRKGGGGPLVIIPTLFLERKPAFLAPHFAKLGVHQQTGGTREFGSEAWFLHSRCGLSFGLQAGTRHSFSELAEKNTLLKAFILISTPPAMLCCASSYLLAAMTPPSPFLGSLHNHLEISSVSDHVADGLLLVTFLGLLCVF